MKRNILFTLAAICMMGCEEFSNYTVSGDFSEYEKNYYIPAKVDSVCIINDSTTSASAGEMVICEVEDGKFSFCGFVERPIYSLLRVYMTVEYEGEKHKSVEQIPFILEPGNIELQGDKFRGTSLNDASVEMRNKLLDLEFKEEYEKAKKEATSFIKQHAEDPASVYLIVEMTRCMEARDLLPLIDLCSEDMQHTNTGFAMARNQIVKEANAPQAGDMFADFAVEYNGKTTRLSDYVGKGQYVLVDF